MIPKARRSLNFPHAGALLLIVGGIVWCQDPTYRSEVSLVGVDVQVTVGERIVEGLKRTDFLILDDGQARPVLHCSQDEEALDVVLLFDVSRSMGPGLVQMAASARRALTELRKGDRVAAMAFNTRNWMVFPLTGNIDWAADELSARIPRTDFDGGTYILDALAGAASYLKKLPALAGRHRTVFVFTDNDGYGVGTPKGVVKSMWEANAVVNGIVIPNAETIALRLGVFGWRRMESQDDINPVVDQTGGETINAAQSGTAFQDMIRRMRKRYTLYYDMPPGKPGQRRTVNVTLTDEAQAQFPEAHVLARKGYIVPIGKQKATER